MLQLKGRINSSNVMKVLWVSDEIGLDYEREDIGGAFGKNHEAPYLDLNPNGRIPTVIDGDLVMWESNSIVRYLASTHSAGNLWPTDAAARARCDDFGKVGGPEFVKPSGKSGIAVVETNDLMSSGT